MTNVAKVVGYITLIFLAMGLFFFLLDAVVEATIGDDDDRRCKAFAEAGGGEATNLGRWGPCYVEIGDFRVKSGDIEDR